MPDYTLQPPMQLLGRQVTFQYPPGSCFSCGGIACVLDSLPGDESGRCFGCIQCGVLEYAPAFDDRGRKYAGFATPDEAALIWAQYPDSDFADIVF